MIAGGEHLLGHGFVFLPEGWLTWGGLTHSVLFVVLFCALVDFVKMLVELLGRNEDRPFAMDPSQVTAVIPSRNGERVLPFTVRELARVLPPARMIVVDDGSSDQTSRVARELGCDVHRFEKSKGKAGAIHYAIHRVRTPLTLLLDDDTRLGGARIPTSLITDQGYDAVAFNVLPDRRNRDGAQGNNFLGHVQRYEYGKSMEIGKRFHDVTLSVSCVSGAAGLFRTADLNLFHHRHTGVFQGEDLQRTIIHLMQGRRIAFANEPVWTVAPYSFAEWFRQRLFGWYPGLYHQVANFVRLLFRRGMPWRLRYEMAYNLYTVISDPLKTISIVLIVFIPGMRWWGLVVYLMYLSFELYPYWVVRGPVSGRRAPLRALLIYPLYGALNTLLRTGALFTWFWMRFVSGTMRPRRGPKDRVQ